MLRESLLNQIKQLSFVFVFVFLQQRSLSHTAAMMVTVLVSLIFKVDVGHDYGWWTLPIFTTWQCSVRGECLPLKSNTNRDLVASLSAFPSGQLPATPPKKVKPVWEEKAQTNYFVFPDYSLLYPLQIYTTTLPPQDKLWDPLSAHACWMGTAQKAQEGRLILMEP